MEVRLELELERGGFGTDATVEGDRGHAERVSPRRHVREVGGAASARVAPVVVEAVEAITEPQCGRIAEARRGVFDGHVAAAGRGLRVDAGGLWPAVEHHALRSEERRV